MPIGVYKRTQYHRDINRQSQLGKKLSDATKAKMSERMKGNTFNKGKFGPKNGHYGKKHSEEARRKIALAHKGRKRSNEFRDKMRLVVKRGKDSHLWKGGITPINLKIRSSTEYRLWREAVFKRDDYTCIWCKVRGGKIHADHIKPFACYPELRFAIDNGRTLCKSCHMATDTWGRPKKQTSEIKLTN